MTLLAKQQVLFLEYLLCANPSKHITSWTHYDTRHVRAVTLLWPLLCPQPHRCSVNDCGMEKGSQHASKMHTSITISI